MHAYAGPMGILSFAVGCEAAASGANQTQWRFCPERWETSASTGGGNGAAPARYFSRGLWGTIVFPDETAFLTPALYSQIVTTTPFAPNPLPQTWTKTEALKHSVYTIAKGIEAVAANNTYGDCRTAADAILENAVGLHAQILEDEIVLKDDSAGYQANWREALRLIAERHQEDFDYLELLG
ncbi:MAG: hypothetical protein U0941_30090 [Planctomycetaceae bacterium]